jgi:hypothetical protein
MDSEKLLADEATSQLLSCFLLKLHPQANPIAHLSWNISQHVDCNKIGHKGSNSSTWKDGNKQIEQLQQILLLSPDRHVLWQRS